MAGSDVRSIVFRFIGVDAGAGAGFDKMGGKAKSTFGKLAAGAALAGVAIAGASLHAAANYQTATTQLVTGAGEQQKNIKAVGDGMLRMAGQVGVGAQQLAAGMYNIESAGFHGADGLKVLKTAAEGAKVGGADMAVVSDALTSALNAYHQPATLATFVTNELVNTVKAGKMQMGDLAGSIGNVLPIASAANVKFAEVGGAISTMTAQGTDASTASNRLASLLAALSSPTSAAAQQMKSLGLKTSDVSTALTHNGLHAALDLVTKQIGKKFPEGSGAYVHALATMVGGNDQLKAALQLTGVNAKTFADNTDNIATKSQTAGGAVQGFAQVQETFNQKLDRAKAGAGALAITLGNQLLPMATSVATWLADKAVPALASFGSWVQKNKAWIAPLAITLGTFAAGIFLVRKAILAWRAAQAALNLVLDANPIGLIIIAIAALAAGFVYAYKHCETFRNIVNGALHGVGVAINFVRDHWRVFAMGFAALIGGPMLLAVVALVTHFNGVKHAVGVLVSYAVRGFKYLFDAWMTVVGGIITGAAKMFGWVPGLGGKLKHAAAAFNTFRDQADAAMAGVAADAASWGQKTGSALAAGVIKGITDKHGLVMGSAYLLGHDAGYAAARGAQTRSPSKITTYVGKMIAEGLLHGFRGHAAHVIQGLSAGTQHMLAVVGDRIQATLDKLKARVAAAKQKLHDAIANKRGLAGQIRDSLAGGAGLTGAFDADGNLGSLTGFLGGQVSALKAFATALAQLRRMGLSAGMLGQIANAGPGQGMAIAQQILAGGASGVATLNTQDAEVMKYAGAAGNTAAGAQYDPQISKDRANVHRQTRALERTTHLLEQLLAATLAGRRMDEREIRRALRRLARQTGKAAIA